MPIKVFTILLCDCLKKYSDSDSKQSTLNSFFFLLVLSRTPFRRCWYLIPHFCIFSHSTKHLGCVYIISAEFYFLAHKSNCNVSYYVSICISQNFDFSYLLNQFRTRLEPKCITNRYHWNSVYIFILYFNIILIYKVWSQKTKVL